MAALALVPAGHNPATLYDIEQELQTLLDTEDLVTAEQQDEFRRELAQAMTAAVQKRNRVYQFIRHCEGMADNAAKEIARLQQRKKYAETAKDAMRSAIVAVLESIATLNAKGKKTASLKGDFASFSLRGNDPKVRIDNEALVPSEYKRITVTLPVDQWTALGIPLDGGKLSIDIEAIETAIAAGKTVPGADLPLEGEYSVVIR